MLCTLGAVVLHPDPRPTSSATQPDFCDVTLLSVTGLPKMAIRVGHSCCLKYAENCQMKLNKCLLDHKELPIIC